MGNQTPGFCPEPAALGKSLPPAGTLSFLHLSSYVVGSSDRLISQPASFCHLRMEVSIFKNIKVYSISAVGKICRWAHLPASWCKPPCDKTREGSDWQEGVCGPESSCPSAVTNPCEPVRERSPVGKRRRGIWSSQSPRSSCRSPRGCISGRSPWPRQLSHDSRQEGGPGWPAGGLLPGVGFGTRWLP